MKYDLLNKLDTIIETHKKELSKKLENIVVINKETYLKIHSIIEEMKNSPSVYFERIEEICNLVNINISKTEIDAGKMICQFGFELTEKQIAFIKEQITIIESKLKEVTDVEKYKDEIDEVNNIQKLVKNDRVNNSDDLERLKPYILNDEISFHEFSDGIIDDVLAKIREVKEINEQGVEIVEEREIKNKLTETELIEVFKRFGYDITKMKKNDIEWILKYGEYENIYSILQVLTTYLYDKFKVNKIIPLDFEGRSKQLAILFTSSNKENVIDLFNIVIKTFDDHNAFIEHFNSMLKYPNSFIASKIRYETKGGQSVTGHISTRTEISPLLQIIKKNELLLSDYLKTLPQEKIKSIMSDFWTNSMSLLVGASGSIEKSIIKCSNYNISLNTVLTAPTAILQPTGDFYVNFDHIIELGQEYEDYVLTYPTILHKNQSFINRLIYLVRKKEDVFSSKKTVSPQFKDIQKINIDVPDGLSEEKYISNSVVPIEKHFVSTLTEEKIDNIISNYKINKNHGYVISLKNKYVKKLEENYKVSEYAYSINGIRISRYRILMYIDALVKNQYQIDENIFKYIVFKNMIINETEYNLILSEINKLFENNVINKLILE